MSISPEYHHPQPEDPESGSSLESDDDPYERLWQDIPPVDPSLEPNDGKPHGYSITAPPGFVDAEISQDAEKLYFLLLEAGLPKDSIEWWAERERVDLRRALLELNSWGVLETRRDGGIRVKREYFLD